MDPRKQDLSRIAEKSLQFKPGADVALLNAMINTIIEEGLVDRQYIEKNTTSVIIIMSKRKFIEKINDAFMSSELCTFLVLTHQQYKSVSNSTKPITARRIIILRRLGTIQGFR